MAAADAQAGFFEDLFGASQPAPQPPGTMRAPGDSAGVSRRAKRHGPAKPDPRLIGSISGAPFKSYQHRVMHKERRPIDSTGTGTAARGREPGRFVCVRMCDGAVIALARSDGPTPGEPSCDRACPGAEARLYTLRAVGDDLSTAVDPTDKSSYAQLVARLKSGGDRATCACGSVLTKSDVDIEDFFADATLRNGDLVATSGGLHIFRGGQRSPHKLAEFLAFREARSRLPRMTHGALEAIDRTLKNEKGDASPGSTQ